MIYLAQVFVYTAAMLLIYVLFLRNRPLYQFSRLYLLACAVLPLFIPLLHIPVAVQQQIQNAVPASFYLPEFTLTAGSKGALASQHITSLWYGYALVALYFIVWQLLNVYRLWRVIKNSKKEPRNTYTLVTSSGYGPGSIGKYILFPGEEINKTILAHEEAHIHLHHTRDLVFLNILQAFLWPNVLLYWIKKEIKEVHEFQADALVDPDRAEYAQLLLADIFNTSRVSLMHSFTVHPVRRRLMMLQKINKPATLEFMVQVCLGLVLFIGSAIVVQSCVKKTDTTESEQQQQKLKRQQQIVDEITGKSKPLITQDKSGVYNYVDKMPRTSYDMNAFLGQNLHYPDNVRKKGVEGVVLVRFVVDEHGDIKDPIILRSPDSSLSIETLRVISLMPKWAPGENNGKPVAVYFTMPVVFQL